MGTNCVPLLADIFLYSYKARFIQTLLSTGRKQLAYRFNYICRNIDDVLIINNPEFENYMDKAYPVELEIKDTTGSNTSASYLYYFCRSGGTVNFIFPFMTNVTILFRITNFPFLSSNIPGLPAYGVFISQLKRYARTCSSYECFILRVTRLSNKLREHGYVKERLKSSLKKIYGRYRDLIKQYKVPHSRMLNDISLTKYNENPPSIRLYTNPWHLYRTRPFTDLWEVSVEHLRRV